MCFSNGSPRHTGCELCWGSQLQVLSPFCCENSCISHQSIVLLYINMRLPLRIFMVMLTLCILYVNWETSGIKWRHQIKMLGWGDGVFSFYFWNWGGETRAFPVCNALLFLLSSISLFIKSIEELICSFGFYIKFYIYFLH